MTKQEKVMISTHSYIMCNFDDLHEYEDEREQIAWSECLEFKYVIPWKENYCPNCVVRMGGKNE